MTDQIVLTEGSNVFIADYTVDYREIVTYVILRAGKDVDGNDLVALAWDEAAAILYGKRTAVFSENQWTTQVLAELRAAQILSEKKEPAITLRVEAPAYLVKVGDAITFISTTLGLNTNFVVQSVEHVSGEDGNMMSAEMTNKTATLVDFLTVMQRNLEKR